MKNIQKNAGGLIIHEFFCIFSPCHKGAKFTSVGYLTQFVASAAMPWAEDCHAGVVIPLQKFMTSDKKKASEISEIVGVRETGFEPFIII